MNENEKLFNMNENAKLMHHLGMIEGKLDTLITQHQEHRQEDMALHEQLETDHQRIVERVSKVETKQAWGAGVVAAVVAGFGALELWFRS